MMPPLGVPCKSSLGTWRNHADDYASTAVKPQELPGPDSIPTIRDLVVPKLAGVTGLTLFQY